ncbi:VOC family protein [Alkalihalobacillus sp. 1P02AB]|uniref:VOC family protein n=1 Tax=Alkalihalobacillus sp. 1P02AB TaxID=3132260 RepID=UPI0039A5F1F5
MYALHHIGIEVQHLQNSLQFYQDFFDAKVGESFLMDDDEIVFIELDSFTIELIHSKQTVRKTQPATVHFALKVPNLMEEITALTKKGFTASDGPYHLSNGLKVVYYEGLDHEVIELME